MTRILADLPDEDIAWLDRMAEREGKSRAAVLREAVASFKAGPRDGDADLSWLDAGFGLWARAAVPIKPEDYDRKRRAEWTRYWDDDYEEVRAETPETFDAEDDRQRRIYLDMIAGKYPAPRKPPGG